MSRSSRAAAGGVRLADVSEVRPRLHRRLGGRDVRPARQAQITSLGNLSKWAFLLCLAGVGLNFDLREIARSGVRPLVVAALGLVVVAAYSLGLVLLTSGWLHL